MPTIREHRKFVASHPYRAWYLIKTPQGHVGTIYITKLNAVGVSTVKGAEKYIPAAIRFVLRKYDPLPAIKSVRAAKFDFNVSPRNKKLIGILKSMRVRLERVTYVFGN
jgi:hypothetical protein